MRFFVLSPQVSDFFYPQVGGVETHMFCLAQSLLQRGHRVTILTHQYGDRGGVRHLTGGLKVYHIPRLGFYNSTIFPTVFGLFHVLRDIVLREEIQILHAHQVREQPDSTRRHPDSTRFSYTILLCSFFAFSTKTSGFCDHGPRVHSVGANYGSEGHIHRSQSLRVP